MNSFCSSNPRTDIQKFTILLVRVVASTPLSALCYTFAFAIQLVQDLSRYTKVDHENVLKIDSRIKTAFEGEPKGFAVPSYSVYNHQSTAGIVIF